jgi:hypothetical protein
MFVAQSSRIVGSSAGAPRVLQPTLKKKKGEPLKAGREEGEEGEEGQSRMQKKKEVSDFNQISLGWQVRSSVTVRRSKQSVRRFVGWIPKGAPADVKKKGGRTPKSGKRGRRGRRGRAITDASRTTEPPDTVRIRRCDGRGVLR